MNRMGKMVTFPVVVWRFPGAAGAEDLEGGPASSGTDALASTPLPSSLDGDKQRTGDMSAQWNVMNVLVLSRAPSCKC